MVTTAAATTATATATAAEEFLAGSRPLSHRTQGSNIPLGHLPSLRFMNLAVWFSNLPQQLVLHSFFSLPNYSCMYAMKFLFVCYFRKTCIYVFYYYYYRSEGRCPNGIFDPWVRWDRGLDPARNSSAAVAVVTAIGQISIIV